MSWKQLDRLLAQNATDPERVDAATATEQLQTAAALRQLLIENGGAILGDEVGAGKTYVSFALIAEALLRSPHRGAVIFVPKELLQRKWARQLQEYLRVAVRDRAGRRLAARVITVDRSLRGDGYRGKAGSRPKRNSIVVTRHDIFSRKTREADRALCLDRWLTMRCPATKRPRRWLFERCGLDPWCSTSDGIYWAAEDALWAASDVLSDPVLRLLDVVWEERKSDEVESLFRSQVQEIRREVGRRTLPNAALVVVDEAHHLRSTSSQVYQSLMRVLANRFDALLFLTATPFQLGGYELSRIVEFFRNSQIHAKRSAGFDDKVREMEAAMKAFMEALDDFGVAWAMLEEQEVTASVELATKKEAPADLTGTPAQAARRFHEALAAKERLERGLKPFMVRSVRERNHREFPGLDTQMAELSSSSRIPLALVERLIGELLAARRRTFIASALTSACSSWDALFNASIASDDDGKAFRTRDLLHRLRAAEALGEHPKVRHTVRLCLEGIDRGEKTVVFVERTATGELIRDLVRAELGNWRNEAARERLQTPARFGWPSLRENYLHTLYTEVFGKLPQPKDCLALLEQPYGARLWRLVDVDGRDRDYKTEKRLLEHLVFQAAATRGGWRRGAATVEIRACMDSLLDPRYVMNGLDLTSGESQVTVPVPAEPRRSKPREPNLDFAKAYLAYPSPWIAGASNLNRLGPDARAEIVDAAASAIASSHLQAEVAAIEARRDPKLHFRAMAELLRDRRWHQRISALAEFAADEISGQDPDEAKLRAHHLASALRRGERVQFVHGSVAPDTQQNAVDGFNTPLYPEVLIATDLLGEGLDLHRFCDRVIHHDLPWNPAKLEQRTGRIDRIGSMAERLARERGESGSGVIDVWLPYMDGTYDETIYTRVIARRREFRCVLGSRPEWEDPGDEDAGPPIDEALVSALQVKLGPDPVR